MTAYPWGVRRRRTPATPTSPTPPRSTTARWSFTDGALAGARSRPRDRLAGRRADDRPRLPRAAAGHGLRRRRTTSPPSALRRRPVRQGHRRRSCATRSRSARRAPRRSGSRSRPTRQQDLDGALRDPGRQLAEKAGLARAARRVLQGRPARRPAAAERGRLGQAEPRRPHADRDRPEPALRRRGQGESRRRSRRSRRSRSSAPATRTTRGCSPPTASTRRSRRSRSASSRRSSSTCSRCATSRDTLNARSGKVAHEIVTDGSVYYGANTDAGQHGRDGQVPERRRAGVALDGRRPLPRRALRLLGAQPEVHRQQRSTPTTTAGPRAWATSSAPGMGPEKLDNTVYFIRGLYDLADMAAGQARPGHRTWAGGLADQLRARFDPQWWDAASSQYADSLEDHERRRSSRSTGSASRRWRSS